METRAHVHEESFPASPEALFALLVTPSAIRQWWGASAALVFAELGGIWVARWGAEDEPDYLTGARIEVYEPPRRLMLGQYQYRAKESGLLFDADFQTEFAIRPSEEGATLRVTQRGFPHGPEADAYLDACRQGWRDAFAGIRAYLTG